jgi:haloacetate dehalogenase
MGEAVIDMMAELGYDRFRLAGHDRGGRVSYRLALDHPEKVHKLCLLDMTPNLETFERVEQDFHAAFRM